MRIENLAEEQAFTQELYDYIKKLFHDNNKLWSKVEEKYANASLKLFDDIIKLVYQMTTAMGVVAGFGFIGIGGVKNIAPFILGEGLILTGIIIGMHNIRRIYIANDDSVKKSSLKKRRVFQAKTTLLANAMEDLITNHKLKTRDFYINLTKADRRIGAEFGIGAKEKEEKDESGFMKTMIFLFCLGLVFLLISFVPFGKLHNKHHMNQYRMLQ